MPERALLDIYAPEIDDTRSDAACKRLRARARECYVAERAKLQAEVKKMFKGPMTSKVAKPDKAAKAAARAKAKAATALARLTARAEAKAAKSKAKAESRVAGVVARAAAKRAKKAKKFAKPAPFTVAPLAAVPAPVAVPLPSFTPASMQVRINSPSGWLTKPNGDPVGLVWEKLLSSGDWVTFPAPTVEEIERQYQAWRSFRLGLGIVDIRRTAQAIP